MDSIIVISVMLLLEKLIPYQKFHFIRKGFWIDLIWYQFLQGFLLQILIFKFIDKFYSAYDFHLVSSYNVFIQFFLVFIIVDFIAYWVHRIQHYGHWLWRIHEVHHTSTHLNWLSAARIHGLELVFIRIISGAVIVLLGASETSMYIFAIVQTVLGYFQHANIKMRLGFLNYIITTPEMHRVHHLSDLRCQRSNFADKLSIWDWIFGTAYLPAPEQVADIPYGIGYEYPQSLLGQMLYMFRKKENEMPG